MSPMAKMPGSLVWNFSVSTTSCLRSSASCQSAMGPSLGLMPWKTSSASSGSGAVLPSGLSTWMAVMRPSCCAMPSTWPTTKRMRPASHSSRMRATLAGAA